MNKPWWTGVPDAIFCSVYTKFCRYRSTGLRDGFLKGFYHIWVWWQYWSCDQHHVRKISFPCTRKLTNKIWLKWLSGFWEKPGLNIIYKLPLAKVQKLPWPWMLSHTFINSIGCLHLPTFRSQAAIVPGNPLFSLFHIEKPKIQKPNIPCGPRVMSIFTLRARPAKMMLGEASSPFACRWLDNV